MEFKPNVILGQGMYDWLVGANSPITRTELVSDLDWKPYQVQHEIQWHETYDTLFCVTYSALESIGALFMYYLSHNLISADNVKWLKDNKYLKNGFINFNERFTAIKGESGPNGAYQYKIGNAIKNFGLIPQEMLPMANDFYQNINPDDITEEMYELGREFLKRFTINYEWVSDVKEALKYSPIQMVVRYANYIDPEDILDPEGEYNHAVEGVYSETLYNEIRDTYFQEYKRYNPNKTTSFLAYALTINNNISMDTTKWLKDNDLKWVRNSNTGGFGRVLQGKLMVFNTVDRGTLALLDDKIRGGGVTITNEVWGQLPKENF